MTNNNDTRPFDPTTMFSIKNDGYGNLGLFINGDDEPVASMPLIDDSEKAFRNRVLALVEIYIENSREF